MSDLPRDVQRLLYGRLSLDDLRSLRAAGHGLGARRNTTELMERGRDLRVRELGQLRNLLETALHVRATTREAGRDTIRIRQGHFSARVNRNYIKILSRMRLVTVIVRPSHTYGLNYSGGRPGTMLVDVVRIMRSLGYTFVDTHVGQESRARGNSEVREAVLHATGI